MYVCTKTCGVSAKNSVQCAQKGARLRSQPINVKAFPSELYARRLANNYNAMSMPESKISYI